MTTTIQVEPEVGMGATLCLWSDSHAYTITEVIRYKSGKNAGKIRAVIARRDIAKRIDKNGMSESQDYEYETDLNARAEVFTLRKNGRYLAEGGDGGTRLAIGFRREYYDFSF
jgi:hypothetical protein